MSTLDFLSPSAAPTASPLARALAGADGIRDLSLLGKLEVRRADVAALDVDAEVIRITPARGLVICPAERRAELRSTLPGLVIDVSASLAGIEIEGDALMRRLTDLDLDALPAAGKVADVRALVTRDSTGFRIFFPQEYGDSVVENVRDVQAGLA